MWLHDKFDALEVTDENQRGRGRGRGINRRGVKKPYNSRDTNEPKPNNNKDVVDNSNYRGKSKHYTPKHRDHLQTENGNNNSTSTQSFVNIQNDSQQLPAQPQITEPSQQNSQEPQNTRKIVAPNKRYSSQRVVHDQQFQHQDPANFNQAEPLNAPIQPQYNRKMEKKVEFYVPPRTSAAPPAGNPNEIPGYVGTSNINYMPPAQFTGVPTVYSPNIYNTVTSAVMAPVIPPGPYMVEQGGAYYYYYGAPVYQSTPNEPSKNQQKRGSYKKKSTNAITTTTTTTSASTATNKTKTF